MEIYLDNAATTKVDKRVLKEIINFSEESYANPSSQHNLGARVRKRIDEAREKLANSIGADVSEIIFTSGGTESNNFAIKGLTNSNSTKKHIITSTIEHPSVLKICETLEKSGYEVDYVGVNKEGIIDVEDISKKIRKDTLVVSIMHANNEIGTIQPIKEIGEICKNKKVYFHCDAVQSFGKLAIDVNLLNIDLMSVSGHKVNAPKGVGFLYVRLGTKIRPIIDGGEQEFKLRGGTENTVGIIAFAKAMELDNYEDNIREVRDFMVDEFLKMDGAKINGSLSERLYNNISVSFFGIEGESLMLMLDDEEIFVSTGSACASHKLEESYVLSAINADELYVHGTIRISLGKDTNLEKAKFVIQKIKEKVKKLRDISPFKLEKEKGCGTGCCLKKEGSAPLGVTAGVTRTSEEVPQIGEGGGK